MNTKNLLATVDLGSNSFRLLVGEIQEDGTIVAIDQIKETPRLASGLDENKNLTHSIQLRALEVLSRFSERLQGFSSAQVRVVGTSTLRVANNAAEFISIANKALGYPIEVISGTEEARLIYSGAMHSLPNSDEKRLVIDIGGGSTEFIIGHGFEPKVMESVTMGCVSYTEKFFADKMLSESNFNNAILAARSKVQAMEYLFNRQDWQRAIGTSGTAKTLYDLCVENGLSSEITYSGMVQLKKMLIKSKQIKDINLNGIKEDRKPIIAGGLSIMLGIFEELGIEKMTIADGALREGVMYDLLGRNDNDNLREMTVDYLKNRYGLDIAQGKRVSLLATYLLNLFFNGERTDSERVKLLMWACELYEIGLRISHNDYHKHGSYILQNSDLGGFSKPEQTIIADLVRTHRGSVNKLFVKLNKGYKDRINSRVIYGLMAFRLSVIFNRSRKDIDFKQIIRIENVTERGFDLKIDRQWLFNNPLTLFSLNEEKLQWEPHGVTINLVNS